MSDVALSKVDKYRVKHSVVEAMYYDDDLSFDLEFLRDHETVRLSCNGKSVLICDAVTDQCYAIVDPRTWVVRVGEVIKHVLIDEKFRAAYDAENPVAS